MGRRGHAWFRSERNCYATKIRGKMYDFKHITGPPTEDKQRLADAERERLLAALREATEKLALVEIVVPGASGNKIRAGTVAELVPKYLEAANIKRQTRTDYGDRLRWFVGKYGGVAVGALDAEDIEAAVRREPWTSNTRRTTLGIVQGFVRWCRRTDFKLKLPAVESRGDEAILSPGEFRRVLAFAEGDYHPYLRFLWSTGCRPGEACSLTAELVDLPNGVAVLKEHKTSRKGKKRTIYLTTEPADILRGQLERHPSGHLFRGARGKPFTSRRAGVLFARCADAAGVVGRVLYATRHSFSTRALEQGIPDADVAALLGHANTDMLHRHYAHLLSNARRLRDVAARVA